MAAGPVEWESYMFGSHTCCALDPWTQGDLQIMDVLVKKRTSGDCLVVGRVGDLSYAGHWESSDTQRRISEDLRSFKAAKTSQPDDDFQKGRLPDMNFHVASSSSFLAKILGAGYATARAQMQTENAVKCSVRNLSFQRVRQDFLTSLVTADPPSWKPNTRILNLFGWQSKWLSGKPKRDLWIVTEIKYATMITIGENQSSAVEGDFIAQIPGHETGAQLNVSRARNGRWEVTGPKVNGRSQPFAFAFKAILLQYNKAGNVLVRVQDNVGLKRLQRRGEMPSMDLFDPDKNPLDNMGGLFVQSPDEEGESKSKCLLPMYINAVEFQNIECAEDCGEVAESSLGEL